MYGYLADKTEWKDLWLLTPEQAPLLSGMTDKGRLGFAIQLKFMEMYGRFPLSGKDVSMDVIQYLAQQLGLSGDLFSLYDPQDRQGQRHRQAIRKLLGYRPSAEDDLRQLFDWLCAEVLPLDPKAHHARVGSAPGWPARLHIVICSVHFSLSPK